MESASLSRQEVRNIDRLAIETLGVSGLVLMENAGRGAADAIETFLGGTGFPACSRTGAVGVTMLGSQALEGSRIAIVAGAGNNGGDGYVIARHLSMRGANVSVLLVCDRSKITGDAAANLSIIGKLRLDIRQCMGPELARLASTLREFDLIVDAVGGTGIQGALRGDIATAVEQINAAGRPVVAVDIPTGLDCNTGQALGPAVKAALTVTFVARKKGFDVPGSEAFTGEVLVADIGIPAQKMVSLCG